MAICKFNYGKCDSIATTTLKKNSGEIVQLCEFHHEFLIKFAKMLASGEFEVGDTEESEASHWLIANKIPS